jgi:hypothetical protein
LPGGSGGFGLNQTARIAIADKISCARVAGAQTAITLIPQQPATNSAEETLLPGRRLSSGSFFMVSTVAEPAREARGDD